MTGKVKAMAMELEEAQEMTEQDWAAWSECTAPDDYAEYNRREPAYIPDIDDDFGTSFEIGNTSPTVKDSNATMKWDTDKAPIAWIPRECNEGIATVLAYGAKKYEKDNWRRGIPMSRYISAALRHINAWNAGEDIDPESGLSHIDHAMCGLMFVQWYIKHRPECDDRYRDIGRPVASLAEDTPKEGFNGA